jgi:transcriptional regulator with XRE-family HTH domain
MFYDQLDVLCAEHGLTVSGLLRELNISASSASRWKSKGYEPSREVAKKLADYFGITVRQLMAGEIENVPAPEKSEDEELQELLEEARRNPDLKILFSLGKNATREDVKKYIQMIKLMSGENNGEDDY